MAVNIHITIIELNALHTKRQNLFQELDAVIHLLMEAKHWGLRKSRNATSLNRSEERRVGKECRSRWAPHQSKKKGYPVAAGNRMQRPARPPIPLKTDGRQTSAAERPSTKTRGASQPGRRAPTGMNARCTTLRGF